MVNAMVCDERLGLVCDITPDDRCCRCRYQEAVGPLLMMRSPNSVARQLDKLGASQSTVSSVVEGFKNDSKSRISGTVVCR